MPELWYVVDAKAAILGRIASRIALLLQGKCTPKFAPYAQPNIHVIVVNADSIALTGKKLHDSTEELFYRHTGYVGGLVSETYAQTLSGKRPQDVVIRAIKRMLPKHSPRARQILKCLHVYASPDHPHAAQKPQLLEIADQHPKNRIRQA
jgi:large subunit ribosomal protein L13